ncbi:MAG: DNA modification methylase [bacterium]
MKTQLKTVYVGVDELKPAIYNPRSWSKKAIYDLKKSIKSFGLVDAILVNGAPNRKNVVIGGHFRLHVAKELGYKEVPVCYVYIADIEKEKRLNLTLNKVEGDWNMDLLKDFDLDMLLDVGFDSKDLSPIWDSLLGVENDKFDTEEALEETTEPIVKDGDLFQLGNHRLICGNSLNFDVVKKLVDKDKVSVMYCDPPYNISLDYDKGFGSKSKYGGQVNDSKSEREYRNLIAGTIENGIAFLKKDAHVFYYCDENYIWLIQQSYRDLGIKLKRVALWIKNNQNPTPDSAFNKAYEPCVYGTMGNPYLAPINNLTEVMNREVGNGNDTIEDITNISNLWLAKRLPTTTYEHPTEKPPTLHEKPLLRCSKSGDVVLDLFGGSGSTLIACEQLKRKCLMVEMSPTFCDVIIRRYESLTKTKAIKIEEA